ncbi:MAG: 7-carboxy-7-deazaguanine synthase QueE, partial [Sulfuricellaceae bacterium]|nr:7-carboxy-7-deazaguanine synthase QueE [Sulfuricellaceae bacterium]
VLCDEEDYLWARSLIAERHLPERCAVLFSPVAGQLEPSRLADWILRDRLPVRMQIQLHKILWGNARGK